MLESRSLEIARRQGAEPVEHGKIGDGADLAIFVGERAQTALAQRSRNLGHSLGVCDRGGSIAAQRNRFQIFRSHYGADSATAGVTPFVADRGEAH